MKITSVLLVDSVENSLPFWMERMGWEKTVEVPDGDRIGFVILARGGAELMLQSYGNARKDVPAFIGNPGEHRASLFIEVDDWDDTVKRLNGYQITMAERTTFYGMREIGVFEPNGHVVMFAKAS